MRAGDASPGIISEQGSVASAGANYGFAQPAKPHEQVSSKVAMSQEEEAPPLESEVRDDGPSLFSAATFENQQPTISAGKPI